MFLIVNRFDAAAVKRQSLICSSIFDFQAERLSQRLSTFRISLNLSAARGCP